MVCIFSCTIMIYLKKLDGTKSLNTNQCPAGLSLRNISHYHPKYLWETLGMGEYPTQLPKIYSFSLLNQKSSVPISSVIPCNFHLITLPSRSHCCCIFLLTSGFMYTHVTLIFINWYHNLVFSITKAMNGLRFSQAKFKSSPPFNAICKTFFLLVLVFLFFTLPFLFQTLWNFNWTHFSWDFVACEIIKYNEYQISRNKSRNSVFNAINYNSSEETVK